MFAAVSSILQNPHLTIIPQQHLVCLRLDGGAVYFYVAAYEAVFEAAGDVDYLAVFEDDGVLDLAVGDRAAVVDGRVGAYVGVDDAGVGADDGRAADDRVDDLGALLDDHLALNVAVAVHEARDTGGEVVEHQMVDFEHVFELASVYPPALEDAGVDVVAVVEKVLDGVSDLILVAPGGFYVVN